MTRADELSQQRAASGGGDGASRRGCTVLVPVTRYPVPPRLSARAAVSDSDLARRQIPLSAGLPSFRKLCTEAGAMNLIRVGPDGAQ
eukprot:347740-Hanusia_phi.AAC.1